MLAFQDDAYLEELVLDETMVVDMVVQFPSDSKNLVLKLNPVQDGAQMIHHIHFKMLILPTKYIKF